MASARWSSVHYQSFQVHEQKKHEEDKKHNLLLLFKLNYSFAMPNLCLVVQCLMKVYEEGINLSLQCHASSRQSTEKNIRARRRRSDERKKARVLDIDGGPRSFARSRNFAKRKCKWNEMKWRKACAPRMRGINVQCHELALGFRSSLRPIIASDGV